jgi:urocanate hydratase
MKNGVAVMTALPNHERIDWGLRLSNGGGGGIGESLVNGMKYCNDGSHFVVEIKPSR